jgi:hypothetical protein
MLSTKAQNYTFIDIKVAKSARGGSLAILATLAALLAKLPITAHADPRSPLTRRCLA